MTKNKDRFERFAQRLWRRWYRAAGYAHEFSVVDAVLRYRLQNPKEVRNAQRDVLAGREGLVHMLHRARVTARRRFQKQVEDVAIRMAVLMPVGGRETIARAVRRAGYAVSPSTVRRALLRRGQWDKERADRAC